MADFEVLAPGGHQHLVDKIEEQLDLKADAAMADAVDKVARNQSTREVEGELVSVDDAYGAPMLSLGVDGKSTQVTTTGRNMVNPSTLSNGYIDNSGNVYGTANTYKHTDYLPATAGTTYRVSQGVATFNSIYTAFYDSDKTFIEAKSQNSTYAPTFTAPAETAFMRSSFNGAQASRAQVEVDSGSWIGYEPYTGEKPSPSPDYPQDIMSVDELSLNFSRENILKTVDATLGASLSIIGGALAFVGTASWNAGSKTYVIGENSNFNNSNNYMGQPRLRLYQTYARHIARGTYTFGFTQTGEMTAALRVGKLYEDGLYVQNGTTFEVTGDDWYYILVVQLSNRTTDTTTYLYPQLVTGSTLGEWEPYVCTTVSIDLQDNVLRSLPSGIKDTLELSYLRPSTRDGWAWYGRELVQRVSETTVGACSWIAYYTKNFYSSLNGNCRVAKTGLREYLCSYLVPAGTTSLANSSSNPDDSIFGRANEANVIIRTASSYESAAAFKAVYADAVIQYPLAAPVTTTLDPIELPVLPAPTCTVWADPTTGLTMEYVRDTEIVIDSLYAEIDRAHAAIAPVEHGTSSANYAVGSYLMLDGTFCKVTSAIATGETIAIGTNVVATTVDAELASLA